MKRAPVILVATGLVVAVGLVAALRLRETRDYGAAHHVHTAGDTNYVARLNETTVGRTDAGKAVVISLQLENPNKFEMVLSRNWFVLVDQNKNFYLPTAGGTTSEWIRLPARSTESAEMLSYTVNNEALAGSLGLQLGYQYWVLIKSAAPYTATLNKDEFHTFRRRDW